MKVDFNFKQYYIWEGASEINPVSYTHLDVYKRQKLDTLEQLEIYKHKNNNLHEQTQFKSHILFEHITPHTHTV